MKRISIRLTSVILLFALLVGILASCDLISTPSSSDTLSECRKKGHTVVKATCTDLAYCSVCGEIVGSSYAAHAFSAATCVAPKTCILCGATEGESLGGHSYDDKQDRYCNICGKARDIKVKYTEDYEDPIHELSGDTVVGRNITTKAGKVYYALVYAKGVDANHRITLRLTDGKNTVRTYSYFVSAQLTAVYLPFTATGAETRVEVIAESGSFMTSTPDIKESPYEYNKTKTGTYLVAAEDWEYNEIKVSKETALTGGENRALDAVIVGDYMYAVSDGMLHTLKRSGDSFEKISSSQDYGELRQMSVTPDNKGLIVIARSYGAYAFDISNPAEPKLASHIDTLELASGLDIYGNYLYIADRQFGISIFDISDIYNPDFISSIATGETQNVCYADGYVYAGVWAECKVVICDVTDVDNPVVLNEVPLSGRGDGVFVKDGILYAATGQFGKGESSPRDHAGYGLGNGLEIWNVSDPMNPERLSVVRADGASYPGSNPDLWRVYTSGNFVFFTSVYCGAYVYDVSDLTCPTRVAQYSVFQDGKLNTRWAEKYIYPHQRGLELNQNLYSYPIVDTVVDGKSIYICTGDYSAYNDVYRAELPFEIGTPDKASDNRGTQDPTYDGSFIDNNYKTMFGRDALSYSTVGQVRAVAVYGNYLYLAAGTDGVIILDKATLEEIDRLPTFDITKDVQIYGDYIYTAESTAGIAIYYVGEDPTSPKLVVQKPIANVVQLQLSPDARYALAHTSNCSSLIDLRDMKNPSIYYTDTSFTMVYQYQMSIGCIANRYLMMSATKGIIQIYDFGEGGSFETPTITTWKNQSTGITGICPDGDLAFLGSGNKSYRLDLSDPNFVYDGKIDDQITAVKLTGMSQHPIIIGDYVFSTLRREGTYYIHKINADRTKLTTYKSLKLHGNPCMIVTDGERFYLPLGYAGLVSFSLPGFGN